MNDLVKTLRVACKSESNFNVLISPCVVVEAADLIEQLQARVVELEKERAERDAQVVRRAYEQAAIDFGFEGMANVVTEQANEYAQRIKDGER